MVLHMIDHATRYGIVTRIKSKESSKIIGVAFRFGFPTLVLLRDNGREFNNSKYRGYSVRMWTSL